MKAIPYILVLTAALIGCDAVKDGGDTVFYRSVGYAYNTTDSIYVSVITGTLYYGYGNTGMPGTWCHIRAKPGLTLSETRYKYEYDKLCAKHADTSFNYRGYFYQSYMYLEETIAYDFVSIDLVSDSDFDARHPAGTSLADIVEFRTMTPKPFIDSDYRYEYPNERIKGDYLIHNVPYKWFWPVCRLMADLTPDDMTMMGTTRKTTHLEMAAFRFVARPAAAGEHDMLLTMTTDEGKAFTARFTAVFE